jgi:hypothetical protein
MTEQCNTNMQSGTTVPCPCGCGAQISIYSDGGNCGCGCGCSDKFLKLADEAWMEVLKEKIKCQIIANKDEHMEKLAALIAKANGARWKNKISSKTKSNEFKDELKDFFSSCE